MDHNLKTTLNETHHGEFNEPTKSPTGKDDAAVNQPPFPKLRQETNEKRHSERYHDVQGESRKVSTAHVPPVSPHPRGRQL